MTFSTVVNRKFGCYYPTATGTYNFGNVEQQVGRNFTYYSTFISFDSTTGTHTEITAAANAGHDILLAWAPTKTIGLNFADILTGNHDAHITSWMTFLSGLPRKVVIRFAWEMNGSFSKYSPLYVGSASSNCTSAAQYIQVWQYMYAKASGANNIKWFWCTNASDVPSAGGITLESFYPGNSYVDYIGYDTYNSLNGHWMTPLETLSGKTFSAQADTYTRVTALNTTADVWIGETSCVEQGDPLDVSPTIATGHNKAQWWTEFFTVDALPRLTTINFFDAPGTRNWTFDTSPEALSAFITGFGETSDKDKKVASQPGPQLSYAPAQKRTHQSMIGVTTALQHNRSTTLQDLGDSTADATDEWFSLIGQTLGSTYNASVLWVKWNDANQSYDPPAILRTGTAGERVLTLSSASLQYAGTAVTGDIEIIAKIRPTTWLATGTILSRYDTTGNQRGFQFNCVSNGKLQFIWSADGTTATTIASSIAVPFNTGDIGWVRVTFDVDNGAAGNTAKFYTGTDGVTWTQLGTDVVTGTATSIFASTAPYQIGSHSAGIVTPFAGDVMWVQLRNALTDGTDQIPPLPDDWNQVSSAANNTVITSGGPNILLLCGSQSGQGIAYLDNATRRPKLIAPFGQDVIFLNTGHNDTGTGLEYVTLYAAWVANIKSGRPNIPIIMVTQNPTKIGSLITNSNSQTTRAARTAQAAAWAASQPGITVVDTHVAFTDPNGQVQADGLHPNNAGHAMQAGFLLQFLTPAVL